MRIAQERYASAHRSKASPVIIHNIHIVAKTAFSRHGIEHRVLVLWNECRSGDLLEL